VAINKSKFKGLKNPIFIGLGQEKNPPALDLAKGKIHIFWTVIF
jgi:hypothetical protein